jgi:hypothetical protein
MIKINQYTFKENCLNSALNYNTKEEWKKNDGGAYSASLKNRWYKEATLHMNNVKTPYNKKWYLETCIEDAKKYNSVNEWRKNSNGWNVAYNNNWLDECTKHMITSTNIKGYWTKEKCLESSKDYLNIRQWQINGGGAYQSAKKNGWINECTKHMIKRKNNV